ncbi:MAG: hypothetical protein JXR96_05635 [Deltaproteobacteria bacterium]|nr:hypothetical protein [Deltaproteobacteria bacterium]
MGSRLKGGKGKTRSKEKDTPVLKLVVYALLTLLALGVLWYLWLSDEGLDKARKIRAEQERPGADGP